MLMLPRADLTLFEISHFGQTMVGIGNRHQRCTPSVVGKPLPTSWGAKIDWERLLRGKIRSSS